MIAIVSSLQSTPCKDSVFSDKRHIFRDISIIKQVYLTNLNSSGNSKVVNDLEKVQICKPNLSNMAVR